MRANITVLQQKRPGGRRDRRLTLIDRWHQVREGHQHRVAVAAEVAAQVVVDVAVKVVVEVAVEVAVQVVVEVTVDAVVDVDVDVVVELVVDARVKIVVEVAVVKIAVFWGRSGGEEDRRGRYPISWERRDRRTLIWRGDC